MVAQRGYGEYLRRRMPQGDALVVNRGFRAPDPNAHFMSALSRATVQGGAGPEWASC